MINTNRICPNPECRFHNPEHAATKRWYRPHGYYSCPNNPEKQIRRYRCSTCGRTFSETYFTRLWHMQRKDIDEVELLFEWCKGTSITDLAKLYACSPKAIEMRIIRMRELAHSKDVVIDIEAPAQKRL